MADHVAGNKALIEKGAKILKKSNVTQRGKLTALFSEISDTSRRLAPAIGQLALL
jgi:hypothetical protein